jgi:NADPH:quinone reductase-like Zn-dependent oxidoreductase
MRAWTYTSRGAPRDVLSLQSAHPMPPPPSGVDLLVRVSHVALNPAGEVRMSLIPSVFGRPFIPELDFCGWVQQAGPAAPSFLAEGTAVWGSLSPKATMSGAGTLAEYLVVPADRVVTKPTQIDFAEASGLSTVGQTAIKMVQTAGVKRGDRVLVNGASGGVGTVLVQIAKAAGVEVVATCSEPNIAMLKGLGADEVS